MSGRLSDRPPLLLRRRSAALSLSIRRRPAVAAPPSRRHTAASSPQPSRRRAAPLPFDRARPPNAITAFGSFFGNRDEFYSDEGYTLSFGDFPPATYDIDGLVIMFGTHGFDALDGDFDELEEFTSPTVSTTPKDRIWVTNS
ncbi:hypothetical protein CASFOL_041518 [Castilleja foliolosa]|uniref:Uncharacterized protein n=1 Tax=Castilleja foliolosa TaxID=1961234 RepID=A0ABD3BB76_9LAMI